MKTIPEFLSEIKRSDYLSLARILTIVENELNGADYILTSILPSSAIPVIGITGPPGAGKSTLVNSLIGKLRLQDKKIAVLAVDPTSPFNYGSLLGDRVRMSAHFDDPNVFIRSIATRGSLGGLSAKTIEMVDVLKSSGFDYILIETVGVGQSEVEIAGLADLTIVVLVPESGDEIQNIKSGLMEVADIFVVNKADREGADLFANNLKKLVHQKSSSIPILKTIADKAIGIEDLVMEIYNYQKKDNPRKRFLLAEKAWKLIQHKRMSIINKTKLQHDIAEASKDVNFNLYLFIDSYLPNEDQESKNS